MIFRGAFQSLPLCDSVIKALAPSELLEIK